MKMLKNRFLNWLVSIIAHGIVCIPLSFLMALCLDILFETEFLDNVKVLFITLWILIPWLKSYYKTI